MKKSIFFKAADLMIDILPEISKEGSFALKGGTAINFFWRDLPRLSIDIDLCYLPLEDRNTSLRNISLTLDRIANSIEKLPKKLRVHRNFAKGDRRISKLVISNSDTQVKIEPNEILRGFVFECIDKDLCMKAQELFEKSVSVRTLSLADLYGGKICAALDRQHPRDLFDIKILMDNEGISDQIRAAFVIYLSCTDRPMNELLDPMKKDIEQIFKKEFLGMTLIPITLNDLLTARENLISLMKRELIDRERKFLLSLKEGEPNWSLMNIKGIENLPAIQWKLINIRKMEKKKHKEAVEKLRRVLKL